MHIRWGVGLGQQRSRAVSKKLIHFTQYRLQFWYCRAKILQIIRYSRSESHLVLILNQFGCWKKLESLKVVKPPKNIKYQQWKKTCFSTVAGNGTIGMVFVPPMFYSSTPGIFETKWTRSVVVSNSFFVFGLWLRPSRLRSATSRLEAFSSAPQSNSSSVFPLHFTQPIHNRMRRMNEL